MNQSVVPSYLETKVVPYAHVTYPFHSVYVGEIHPASADE
jgi:hypothetical protein